MPASKNLHKTGFSSKRSEPSIERLSQVAARLVQIQARSGVEGAVAQRFGGRLVETGFVVGRKAAEGPEAEGGRDRRD
jgi:hypothetical protein